METYTLLILDNETEEPKFTFIVPDQLIEKAKWIELTRSLAKVFDVEENNVVFGHDYYASRIKEYQKWLTDLKEIETEEESIELELEYGTYEERKLEISEELYHLEHNLIYELPNPLK